MHRSNRHLRHYLQRTHNLPIDRRHQRRLLMLHPTHRLPTAHNVPRLRTTPLLIVLQTRALRHNADLPLTRTRGPHRINNILQLINSRRGHLRTNPRATQGILHHRLHVRRIAFLTRGASECGGPGHCFPVQHHLCLRILQTSYRIPLHSISRANIPNIFSPTRVRHLR